MKLKVNTNKLYCRDRKLEKLNVLGEIQHHVIWDHQHISLLGLVKIKLLRIKHEILIWFLPYFSIFTNRDYC